MFSFLLYSAAAAVSCCVCRWAVGRSVHSVATCNRLFIVNISIPVSQDHYSHEQLDYQCLIKFITEVHLTSVLLDDDHQSISHVLASDGAVTTEAGALVSDILQ